MLSRHHHMGRVITIRMAHKNFAFVLCLRRMMTLRR